MGLIRYFRLRSRPRLSCIKIYKKSYAGVYTKMTTVPRVTNTKKLGKHNESAQQKFQQRLKHIWVWLSGRGGGANPPLTSPQLKLELGSHFNWMVARLLGVAAIWHQSVVCIRSLPWMKRNQNRTRQWTIYRCLNNLLENHWIASEARNEFVTLLTWAFWCQLGPLAEWLSVPKHT